MSIVWKYAADQRRYTRPLSPSPPRVNDARFLLVRSYPFSFACLLLLLLLLVLEPWIVSVTRAHASSCTQFVPFDRGGTPRSTALELFLLLLLLLLPLLLLLLLSALFFTSGYSFFLPPLSFPLGRGSVADESRWNRRRNTNTRRNFFPGCFILRATGRGRGWGVRIENSTVKVGELPSRRKD